MILFDDVQYDTNGNQVTADNRFNLSIQVMFMQLIKDSNFGLRYTLK
jgi:hypothetical protein